jgi:hypothetical protein
LHASSSDGGVAAGCHGKTAGGGVFDKSAKNPPESPKPVTFALPLEWKFVIGFSIPRAELYQKQHLLLLFAVGKLSYLSVRGAFQPAYHQT